MRRGFLETETEAQLTGSTWTSGMSVQPSETTQPQASSQPTAAAGVDTARPAEDLHSHRQNQEK